MSSIEQAVQRLKELQNSGAVAREDASNSNKPEPGGVPTPEAVVRALEGTPAARLLTARASQPAQKPAAPIDAPPSTRIPASRTPDLPQKRLEIDVARLRARGFVTPDAPQQLADEFRVLKRPIIRNATGSSGVTVKNGNLVMVTSALPGEGKTFTSVNLAMSIALEYDNTVLLVDGDVANPQFPNLLGVPNAPGLLDLLTRDDIDVGDTLFRTSVEKLTIMAAGSRHPRATELLASEQMAALLRELGSRYSDRIIIFDSPPLLSTTEARVMASHMGQIVMVVSANSTTQHAVQTALATIESCEVVLMMLNKASRTDVGTYYGYYGDAERT